MNSIHITHIYSCPFPLHSDIFYFMQIDVMVNNAGSAVRGAFMLSPLEGLTETLDLNVKASVMLTRLLAPRIARRGTGTGGDACVL